MMTKIEFHDSFIYWNSDKGEILAKVKIWYGEDFLKKELMKKQRLTPKRLAQIL
jgi:hypothetical protein